MNPISFNRRQFLKAVQEVIAKLEDYWPLSIRQIHYRLLNNPPLTLTPERSWYGPDKYRYRNDLASYEALSDLCTSARYFGEIQWEAIDDSTRTLSHHIGFRNVAEFINQEMEEFLLGYNRDKQYDQPIHIEVLIEKNTLMNIVRPICRKYYVPMTSGRGFAGPSVWRKMAERFEDSGKKRMALLIVSDYDPEGFVLADDAIRSLRDLWELPIDYHRVAVTKRQIQELDLQDDFNPIKKGSPNRDNFIRRTRGQRTWECEALDPEYLRNQLRMAIEANMNMEILKANQAKELEDTKEIHRIRTEITKSFAA